MICNMIYVIKGCEQISKKPLYYIRDCNGPLKGGKILFDTLDELLKDLKQNEIKPANCYVKTWDEEIIGEFSSKEEMIENFIEYLL